MNFALWRDRLILLVLAVLPWQGRYIKEDADLNGFPWEQGVVSLFAIELLIFFALLSHLLSGASTAPDARREASSSFRLWALLLLYALISVFWSRDTLTGLFTWFHLFDGFALAFLLWTSNLTIRKCLAAFLVGASIAGAVGIGQFFMQTAGSSTWLGMAAHDPAATGTCGCPQTSTILRVW